MEYSVILDDGSVDMNNNIKQSILNEIQNKCEVFHKVSYDQYRIRCPLCGDSQKNLSTAHLYLKCSLDPTEPILYNCFKCNSKGRLDKRLLDKLNISIDGVSDIDNQIYNKISVKKMNIDILTGTPNPASEQVNYITNRLGKGLSLEDYDKFKIVWNIESLNPHITDVRVKNTLPSNRDSISFLSEDKSALLTRLFVDEYPRWRKRKIFPSSDKSLYTIKAQLDLFSEDPIIINIAEGIIDIISIYKNFNTGPNSIYIATLGSDYEDGIVFAIKNGFIGSNIIVKIYIDNDIDEKILKYRLRKYKWLTDRIYIYKNIKFEDFGTTPENIKLMEYLL